ncbi:hypothetical protein HMN09_00847200 [Mycena chlorophos]|uniref:F-box domain-containing protein n=1 Tax=Mycena chlorophos TaxID=658473 RepID=A0A8H6SV20_MYCCL|nr:hypothetical protein HMN09_00847200 [Mycena chlorophos]
MMSKSKTPLLPEELLHEILTYVSDADLLALATLSTHIHALVLTLHLRRHRVSPADLAAGVIPLGTLGIIGTIHVLRMGARAGLLVPPIDVINVRFHFSLNNRTQRDENIVRQITALSKLPQDLLGIKHISLQFTPHRLPSPALASIDTESLLYSLLRDRVTRPVVLISPLSCSIVRPRRPRNALGLFRTKKVQEPDLRSALYVLAVLRGAASCIPAIDIDASPQDSPVGSIVLIRKTSIERMTIVGNTLDARFRTRELGAVLALTSLPNLKSFRIEGIGVAENALMGFLSRHPQTLRLPPPRCFAWTSGMPVRGQLFLWTAACLSRAYAAPLAEQRSRWEVRNLVSRSGSVSIGPIVAIVVGGFMLLLFVACCLFHPFRRAPHVAQRRHSTSSDPLVLRLSESTGMPPMIESTVSQPVFLPSSYAHAPERQRLTDRSRGPNFGLAIPRRLSLSSRNRRRFVKTPPTVFEIAEDVDAELPWEKRNEGVEQECASAGWPSPTRPWAEQRIPSVLRPGRWHPATPTQVANPTIPHAAEPRFRRRPLSYPAPAAIRQGVRAGPLRLHRAAPSPAAKDAEDLLTGRFAADDTSSSIISLPLPPYTPSPSDESQAAPAPPSSIQAQQPSLELPVSCIGPFMLTSPSPPIQTQRPPSDSHLPAPNRTQCPSGSPVLRGPRAPVRNSLRVPVPPVQIVISPSTVFDLELLLPRALQRDLTASSEGSDTASSLTEMSFVSQSVREHDPPDADMVSAATFGGGTASVSQSQSRAAVFTTGGLDIETMTISSFAPSASASSSRSSGSAGTFGRGLDSDLVPNNGRDATSIISGTPSSLDVNVLTGQGW